jgi:1-acyl-sn-glycerol-3-phosphate acyltransferase
MLLKRFWLVICFFLFMVFTMLPIRLILFFFVTLIMGTSGCVVAMLGDTRLNTELLARILWWHARIWAKVCLFLALVWVHVEGMKEYATQAGSKVIVSNHFSFLDIIVLLAVVREPSVWVVKESIMKFPLFGDYLRLSGFISTKRDGSTKDKTEVMERVQERLTIRNISVLFFPEGTRSPDEKVGSFGGAAFISSLKAKKPLVGFVVEGTDRLCPKGKLFPRSGVVTVSYVGKIDSEEFKGKPRDFSECVRQRIVDRLEKIRSRSTCT